jgi:hypothetical protein
MTCSTTYTPASAYGTTYPTTCQNAVNSNYQISYVAGKLTVIAIPPTMSPANGSVLAGSSQIFSWTNSNPTATSFNINVGTMGVGSSNVYFANGVSSPLTVNGLPTAGQTVYVRLSYYMRGVIQSVDLTYKAAGTPTPPALTTSPAPVGGVLPAGTSTTFTWTASNPAASTYGILVGTQGVGSGNIRVASGVSSPYTVNAMPTAGQTVYVRLNYTVAGVTLSVDYTFKAAGAATPPVLTAVGAVAGVLPSGTTATFTWTASNPVASTYGILVGTQGVGSGNIKVASGVSSPYTVNGLPATHGTTIYVRLNYTIIGVTQSVDYTFKTF